jgi:DNA repair protein RecO (recombination protein O)
LSGIYTTEGIVLRSLKYKESSIITDIYSLDYGLRSYIIGGVRSKKTVGRSNLFHPGNIVEITAYPTKGDSLARIKEIGYKQHYNRINQQVVVSMVNAFVIEICQKSIKEKEQNVALYNFLKSSLNYLDQIDTSLKAFHIKFMIDLTNHLGFSPLNNYSTTNQIFSIEDGLFVSGQNRKSGLFGKESSSLLSILIKTPNNEVGSVQVNKNLRDELLDDLINYYSYHIDNFGMMKSLDVLRTILS